MLEKIKNIYNFYVERYKKRFLYCFAIYYGLVIVGMVIGLLYPPISTGTGGNISSQFSTVFPGLLQAIGAGDVIKVILTIFVFNSILGSFLAITVLNLIGIGTLVFIYRPIMWGLIYAPTSPSATMLLIAVIPTLILEGAAYVIAFTASLDFVLAIAKPKALGEESRFKAWKKAWTYNLKSYVLVLIMLLVAAVVESVTLISLAMV
ncbi:stage II sporulation protein M [Methanobacterium sp. MBAC-LM]|uniref:stage II sporulation protein M n=1 Tax=Methanobacterium sp. MBAC-LM TaxID=3412034 RepID=UPI003C7881E6